MEKKRLKRIFLLGCVLLFIVLFIALSRAMCSEYNQRIAMALYGQKTPLTFRQVVKASTNRKPIYIFLHACNVGHWKEVLNEQLESIVQSGLYGACTKLFYACSCKDCVHEISTFMMQYSKAERLNVSYPINTHENGTINEIIAFSKSHDAHVLYLHTKGVTNTSANQTYWRRFMMTYNVLFWKQCVDLLNSGYLTTGVNKLSAFGKTPHYSGNFWWAQTEYLRTLTPITDMTNRLEAEMKLLSNRQYQRHINFDVEFWISVYHPLLPATGLYTKEPLDFTENNEKHSYFLHHPDELPIAIF